MRSIGLFFLMMTSLACGDDSSPGTDAGDMDAAMDAAESDAGNDDAGEMDAGEMDAGDDDAGEDDAGGDAGGDDAAMMTMPVACADFPIEIDAPSSIVFGCDLDTVDCRFFGPNSDDIVASRNRCGDDSDMIDLSFNHNRATPDDAFVRSGLWSIVAGSMGSVQMGFFSQLIGLPLDTEVTVTVENEDGDQYDIAFTIVDDPSRVVISSITAL